MFSRKHVVITGTGRTGTTFLVELLTRLGLDTGFTAEDIDSNKFEDARAGLERDIRHKSCPYIVKSPSFCDYAGDVIRRRDIEIEHVFVPVRDLNAAAESRRYVEKSTVANKGLVGRVRHLVKPWEVPGGLLHTHAMKSGKQEEILLRQIYKLILAVSDTTIPVTFMRFPKITSDGPYLFRKLKPIFQEVRYETFLAVFGETVRPELVHRFNKNDH